MANNGCQRVFRARVAPCQAGGAAGPYDPWYYPTDGLVPVPTRRSSHYGAFIHRIEPAAPIDDPDSKSGMLSTKYRIAIIAGQLVVGGAERQLCLWLSHMDREKFEPVVVTLHPGHGDYWENYVEQLRIPLIRIPRRSCRALRLVAIVRALHPYRPHLIHGWHLFASPYAGAAAKLLGAKSLGGLRDSFRRFCSTPAEATMTMYLADAILVNSFSAAGQLRAVRKLGKEVVYVVQNAVEDQGLNTSLARRKLISEFGFSPDRIWIGSLGRLDPKKRFDLLLKAIALLNQEEKSFHFLLIGDGVERSRLEAMAGTLGISEQVTFAGEIPGASALLSALDVFCFTSMDEGIPNAVMEAAVAGVPIISWRVPFIEELLDGGKVALLVEPGDIVGFRDALMSLIHSRDLRRDIGEAGRRHVLEQFTLQRFVKNMNVVYDDLLRSQRTRHLTPL